MATVLIVDDEDGVRRGLATALSIFDHTTIEAKDGKEAQIILNNHAIDLVIADIAMPNLDGIELLTWIKKNKKIPVILITGFSNLLETKEAFDLGADDFLSKPFGLDEIHRCFIQLGKKYPILIKGPENDDVSSTAKENSNDNPLNSPDVSTKIPMASLSDPPTSLFEDEELSSDELKGSRFCQVPIEDFLDFEPLRVNIYIRLSAEKYLRLAHKGSTLACDRVESYSLKGVQYFYVRKEEFLSLVELNAQFFETSNECDSPLDVQKEDFLKYSDEILRRRINLDKLDCKALNHAIQNVSLYLSLVTQNDSLFELLSSLQKNSDWIYTHSLGVSTVAVMIGRKMGFSSTPALFKIGVAGIFHDVGKKDMDRVLLTKSRPLLTIEERIEIDKHPQMAKEALEKIGCLSADLIEIIYEHHETCDGMGYPNRLKKEKISPIARVIFLADKFCNLALPSPHSVGSDTIRTLKLISETHSSQLDPRAFSALRSLCIAN